MTISAERELFALSTQQERLFRLGVEPSTRGFEARFDIALRTGGRFEGPAVKAALERMVARHEVLRTRFELLPGLTVPLQSVVEGAAAVVLLDGLEDHEVVPLGRRRIADGASLVGALVEPDRLVLLLSSHLVDTASGPVLAGELARELGLGAAAVPHEDDEPLQYVQYAQFQRDLLEESPEEAGVDFWRAWSQGDEAILHRPTLPWRRPGEPSTLPDQPPERVVVDEVVLELSTLRRVAESLGVTDEELILAAWLAFLHRLAESPPGERLAAGRLVDGRSFAELSSVPGLFARTVPVAVAWRPEMTWSDWCDAVAVAARESARWQDGFVREDGRPWRCGLLWEPDAGDPATTPLGLVRATARVDRFELALRCAPDPSDGGRRFLALEAEPDIFRPPALEAFAAGFGTLLAAALHRPTAKLGELPAAAGERSDHRLDGVRRPELHGTDLATLFFETAARHPERVAVDGPDGTIPYGELARRVRRGAAVLGRHLAGHGGEALVAVEVPPTRETVAAVLAVAAAGAAWVPLDPEHPPERRRLVLEDAAPSLLLAAGQESAAVVGGGEVRTLPVTRLFDSGDGEEGDGEAAAPSVTPDPDRLAYVLYTSGSTGRPKGVAVSHRGLANYLGWCREAYRPDEGGATPVHGSLAYDLSLTALLGPLVAGGTVLLPRATGPGALVAQLAAAGSGGAALVKLTPGHARLLVQQTGGGESLRGAARTVVLGGEILLPGDVAAWRAADPRAELVNEYGPTETVVGCAVFTVGPGEDPREVAAGHGARAGLPVGRPIANMRCLVLDRRGRPVAPGTVGELHVGGAGVARGYRGRPAATAERFVPDPESPAGEPGARLYRTGDLARLLVPPGDGAAEGLVLEVLGRTDDQLKIRGLRVEPGEVGAVLGSHPAVAEAAVGLFRPEGDEEGRLAAWVVLGGDDSRPAPAVAELRRFLAERLPEPMVPVLWSFLDRLPLSAAGKVDRRALPAPGRAAGAGGRGERPRTEEEEILAGAFALALDLPEAVGIDQRWFDLGGDSIRTIRAVQQARERGIELASDDIFEAQTVRELARRSGARRLDPGSVPRTAPFELVRPADRRRLDPGGVEDAYPLARLQAGMLFESEDRASSSVYHDVFSYRLCAPVVPAALRLAVERLVERHGALRTTFDLDRFSEPLQLVHRRIPTPFVVVDLTALPAARREVEWAGWVDQERRRPFDLVRGPLVRFAMHLLGERELAFSLGFHHAVLDGWSDATLLVELARSYVLLVAGEPLPFTVPATPFRDFVALERETIASAEARRFWTGRLTEPSPAEPLVVPRLRPPEAGARGVRRAGVTVSEEVSDGLHRLARRAVVPVKAVLLAGHLRLLGHLAAETDVLTTVTTFGRPETTDAERTLGLFLNSLPVRVELSDESWESLARRVHAEERALFPHRRFPLAELQRIAGKRLSETHFYFTHYHLFRAFDGLPELELVDWRGYEETSYALLSNCSLDPFEGRVRVEVLADPRTFDQARVEEVAELWGRLLAAMAARPDASALAPLATPAERQALWAAAVGAPPPAAEPVVRRIERQAARHPEREALWVAPSAGRRTGDGAAVSWSYRRLGERSGELARTLRAAGAGPEVPVGLLLPRRPALVAAWLALWRAGAAVVPLEPDLPDARLAAIAAEAGLPLVVTDTAGLARLPRQVATVVVDPEEARVLSAPPEADGPRPVEAVLCAERLSHVVFTSGSTGRPKGVAIPASATDAFLAWASAALPPEAAAGLVPVRLLAATSVSFDLAVYELFAPLVCGGTVVLVENVLDLAGADPERGEEALGRPSLVNTVPSALAEVLAARARLPRSVRAVQLAGEALSADLAGRLLALAGVERLANLYGPSEATTYATAAAIDPRETADGRMPPIGRPLPGYVAAVLDARLEPVPDGAAGELCLGGVGLARGYLGRPAATAERFVPDPSGGRGASEPGSRLYRTGDLARRSGDGRLEFLGRIDRQVKVRGVRIEPGEVEAALRSLEGVAEAVVEARPGPDGRRRLVAWVQAKAGAEPEARALRLELSRRLPSQLVPAAIARVDRFFRTASGKIDRRALETPSVEDEALSAARWSAPRDPREERLAAVWRQVLGVERLGVHDDFFELGGDSILALQLAARARRAGFAVAPRDLFAHPTVARLAAATVGAPGAEGEETRLPARAPLPRGEVATTPAQRWFFERIGAVEHWNQSLLLAPAGRIDLPRLAAALDALGRRHPGLGLRFDPTGRATVEPAGELGTAGLAVVDLGGLGGEATHRAALAAAVERAAEGLCFGRGRLVRPVLVRGAEPSQDPRDRLLLVAHHLVVDGVSWRVLLEELGAFLAGASEEDLPEPTVPPWAWAEALERWAGSDEAHRAVERWVAAAGGGPTGAPALRTLPLDRPELPDRAGEARAVTVRLGRETTATLLGPAAKRSRTDPEEVALAALAVALGRWCGPTGALRVDLERHGRDGAPAGLDLERTVGWLTAFVPLRLELHRLGAGPGGAGAPDEAAALRVVKRLLRRLPGPPAEWGALSFAAPEAVRRRAGTLAPPQVVLNYLGRLDLALPESSPFRPAPEPPGPARARWAPRPWPLVVDARVVDGRFELDLEHGPRHDPGKIRALARELERALETLVEVAANEPVVVVDEVPLARAAFATDDGDERLGALLRELGDIEELAVATPIQQGILFHRAVGDDPEIYHLQLDVELVGELDPAAFLGAWEHLARRHGILRTRFVERGADLPLQVVERRATMPFELLDWRAGAPETAGASPDERIASWLEADRRRGFDPAVAPLSRLALVRTADRRFRLLWSHHHAILDGWSGTLLLAEALGAYEALLGGRPPELPPARPYTEYVAWLGAQDPTLARAFWRRALAGLDPAAGRLPRLPDPEPGGGERLRLDGALDPSATARLERWARERRLTLHTVLLGLLGLVLDRLLADADPARSRVVREVVLGSTTSGRPAGLAGVESMAGVFVSTVPVRLAIDPEAPLERWLAALQLAQMERAEHGWVSPVDLRRASGLAPGEPLFESLFAFDNYPVGPALAAARSDAGAAGLRVASLAFADFNDLPLSVSAAPEPDGLRITAKLDRRRLAPAVGERLVGRVLALARALPEAAEMARLGDLADRLDAFDQLEDERQRTALVGARARRFERLRSTTSPSETS